MSALLLAALVMGFLGSAHCLGMCGGLASALGMAIPQSARRWHLLLLASLGRVTAYSLMGALGGAALGQLELGIAPRLIAGIMLVLTGCYLAGWWRVLTHLEKVGGRLWRALSPWRARLLPVNSPAKALAFGAIWGWLPCGLVYSAWVFAVSSAAAQGQQGALLAALCMAAFGLGTVPAVMAGGLAAASLRVWLQGPWVRHLLGACYLLFGLWTIYGAWAHAGHNHSDHQAHAEHAHSGMQHGQEAQSQPNHQHSHPSEPSAPASTKEPAEHAHHSGHHHHPSHDQNTHNPGAEHSDHEHSQHGYAPEDLQGDPEPSLSEQAQEEARLERQAAEAQLQQEHSAPQNTP